MRLFAIALLLLPGLPIVAADCPAEGICIHDEVEGDPHCTAETSQGSRGTAVYVDEGDAHASASGRDACGRGRSDKDPSGPYYADRYRVVDLFVAGPVGVAFVWQEHSYTADGVAYSEGCAMTAHLVTHDPSAPSVSAPCLASPPDAGWGTLLP